MLHLFLNLSLIIISHFHLAKSTPLAPAIYVFGDSLLDNGNNNWLPTTARANFAPYSRDFPTPVPLGRFTNGRTSVDFLVKFELQAAEYLGLPYPPPYASLFGPNRLGLPNPIPNATLFHPNSFGGYNYASASCGILPETGADLGKCYNFDEQIEMFRQTVESQLSTITYNDSTTRVGDKLSKSIIIVSIGTNDYLNNYFLPISTRKHYDPFQFAQLLIDAFSQQLQRLYNIGARKMVVTDVGPLGCIPTGARRTVKTVLFIKGKCDEEANNILQIFNKKLPFLLNNLTSFLRGSYFIYANLYSLNYDAITNPVKYGLNESMKPCCKTIDGKFLCIPESAPCSNPDKYFFWDGYHPTQAIYSLLTNELFYGSSLTSPINVNQLVQL